MIRRYTKQGASVTIVSDESYDFARFTTVMAKMGFEDQGFIEEPVEAEDITPTSNSQKDGDFPSGAESKELASEKKPRFLE